MSLVASQDRPVVTVIVPMLNEQADIAECIERIAAQTYGVDSIELVLIDSDSNDDTIRVAASAAQRCGISYRIGENPLRRTSIGLNVGLDLANGRYVARVDARSRIAVNYVDTFVEQLDRRPDVGVIGGAQVACARSGRLVDRSIARALNNRWLMGLARYRRSRSSGPADTVWMGFFRAEDLRALGGWDHATALNEDYELNERFRRAGALVWFDSSVRSGYLPRNRVRLVARQYASFGRVKADGWANGRRPAPRQLVLLALPPMAAVLAIGALASFGIVPVMVPVLGLAVAFDLAGGAGPGSPLERIAGLVVNGIVGLSWWWGATAGWFSSRRGRGPHAALAARPTR